MSRVCKFTPNGDKASTKLTRAACEQLENLRSRLTCGIVIQMTVNNRTRVQNLRIWPVLVAFLWDGPICFSLALRVPAACWAWLPLHGNKRLRRSGGWQPWALAGRLRLTGCCSRRMRKPFLLLTDETVFVHTSCTCPRTKTLCLLHWFPANRQLATRSCNPPSVTFVIFALIIQNHSWPFN